MSTSTRILALVLCGGCAYEAPADPEGPDIQNTITGTVAASGIAEPAPVAVLLYAADDPPPPAGTGRPVSFSMVAPGAFAGGEGLLSADFILSEIPDGDWIISGLMDVDRDFSPFYTASNGGATCGDHAGVYPTSAEDPTPAVVSVEGGQLQAGVTVVLAYQYATERPAFVLASGADAVEVATAPAPFALVSTGIHSEILELADPGEPCGALFFVRFVDDDADGVPDPHPNPAYEGLFAAWPKIYLSYTGEGDTALEAGESFVSEAVVSPYLWEGLGGSAPAGVTTPAASLDVLFVPGALHTLPDGSTEIVGGEGLPRGAWSVTVVLETGQTWTLPNETAGFPATVEGFDPALQAGALVVQ